VSAPRLDALNEAIAQARGSALYRERLRGVQLADPEELRTLPFTTRADLEAAGPTGTRAVPVEQVCHYGETSGTSSGVQNSTWLTAGDLTRNADAIRRRHPEVFGPGRVLLNRFPFMAAPAHLIQLIAQRGGGVSIPGGNINWDVPFHRAFALAQRTGAQVLAGMPLEPIVLARVAQELGLEPRKATAFDTFFLGGAPLPPAMQRRMAREWEVTVIELYGSTETMLLGTGCAQGSLHLEDELAFCEVLGDGDAPAPEGREGRLVVTTLGIEGSPLVRFDTGDWVRRLPPCACGDPRPAIVVLGRRADAIELGGRRLDGYDLTDGAAAAADALDSSVFFCVVLPDRVVVRIEDGGGTADPAAAWSGVLGDVPVEFERVAPNDLLDVEVLARSPHVYKPTVLSDWRRPGRRIVSVAEGMIQWPRPTLAELRRLLGRVLRRGRSRRALARRLRRREAPGTAPGADPGRLAGRSGG
jgi:phenylacetate-CoA ligase